MCDTDSHKSAPPMRGAVTARTTAPWQSLTCKWAVLGFLIVVGPEIALAENPLSRLFSSGPTNARPLDPFQSWDKLQIEVAKLDGPSTGNKLIALLSELPGKHPESNFFCAHMLSADYERKWRSESDAARVSDIQKADLKKAWDMQYRKLEDSWKVNIRELNSDNQAFIEILKSSLGKANGTSIQYFAQRFNGHLEEQWKKVSQMPALVAEIDQKFTEWKSAPGPQRADIAKGIISRMEAYKQRDAMKRSFPSAQPDPTLDEKQKRAQTLLKTTGERSYEDAAKLITQALNDAREEDLKRAVSELFRRTF